jgi:hypothetical protein
VLDQEQPVQIFISYARDDDATPPHVPDATGFVTFLHRQIAYAFQKRGPFRPRICQDVDTIGDGDQFETKIKQEIDASAILLVVLSRNWLARPFCRRELELFAQRWSHEGAEGVRRRIVVVGKRHVDPGRRPSLLQGQVGFAFYSLTDPDSHGLEHEFYGVDGAQDARYWRQLEALAEQLLRSAGHLVRERPASVSPPNGRTVYLAKPATDMRKAYDRLVGELTQKGFAVVPDPTQDLIPDATAREVIGRAFAAAEVSIHLLGEKHGPTPEDEPPLVDLQLACAATQAAPFVDKDDRRIGFHRIIWAPRTLDRGAESNGPAGERDPFAVVASFGSEHDGDCVEGDTLSRFVDFLQQHLVRIARPRKRPARAALDRGGAEKSPGRTKIYVDHKEEDADHAYALAQALQQRHGKLNLLMPAFDGSPAEQKRLRKKYLHDCDSVVICWGAASEVWTKVRLAELEDFGGLGRSDDFARRGLVAGPPPGTPKKRFRELLLSDDVTFIDLTEREQPTPEELDRLVPGP